MFKCNEYTLLTVNTIRMITSLVITCKEYLILMCTHLTGINCTVFYLSTVKTSVTLPIDWIRYHVI